MKKDKAVSKINNPAQNTRGQNKFKFQIYRTF